MASGVEERGPIVELRAAVAQLHAVPVAGDAHRDAVYQVKCAAEAFIGATPHLTTLKPDTAYMPVPRCDGCAFWKAGKRQFWKTTDHSKPPAFGECTAARPPKVLLRADGEKHVRMITLDSFGCVQFEARPLTKDEARAVLSMETLT